MSTEKTGGIQSWLENTLVPFANKLQEYKYVQAIRASFLEIISFLVIGSFFMLIRDFPYTQELTAPLAKFLSVGVTLTSDMVAIYLAFSFASNLGKEYGLESKITALLGVMTFLFATQTDLANGNFTTQYMGAPGLFLAILMPAYAVELYRFCIKHNIYIKAPKGVPPAVLTFFKMLIPQVIIVFPVWILVTISGIDIAGAIYTMFGGLANAVDNAWSYTLIRMGFDNTVWFFGVHPWSILGPTFIPLLTQNTLTNAALLEAGKEMTQVATIGLYAGGAMGGTGSVFIIALFCLFSKNKQLRTLGAVSILPASCHISEPILFGLPIMLNPIWFIPFCILQPIGTYLVSGLVTAWGLVGKAYIPFLGFLPGPLIWFLTTMDWRAIPWGIVTGLIIPGIIYYPFFKIHERMLDKEEAENQKIEDSKVLATN